MHAQLTRLERKTLAAKRRPLTPQDFTGDTLVAVDHYMREDGYGNPHIVPEFLANLEDPNELEDEFQDCDPVDASGRLEELFEEFNNSDIFALEMAMLQAGTVEWVGAGRDFRLVAKK